MFLKPENEPDIESIKIDQALSSDFRETFGTEAGQRVLHHMMHRFSVFDSTISINNQGDISPLYTLKREAERSVMLYILATMEQTYETPQQFVEQSQDASRAYQAR